MKDGGYPIPAVINPPDSLCVQIQVPNDEGHRQAFLGALYTLTRWYNWQKDTAHNATAAADVWKLIFADVTAAMYDGMCDMFDVRQNEEEPCTLEKTEDGGETWVEWANLQLCPPKVRLNAGKIQYSTDDGATWEDAPYETGDPTTDSPLYDPLSPDENNQCIAAANAAEVYKAFYDQVAAEIATSASVATIALLIASLFAVFFTAGAAIPFVTAFVTAFIALLAGGAPEAFDPEDVDTLRCIFFCHFDEDGNIDQAGFDAVLADVDEETDSVFPFVYLLLQYTGVAGLNNAARTNSATSADCSDCPCAIPCGTWGLAAPDTGSGNTRTLVMAWDTEVGEEYTITVSGVLVLATIANAHRLDACYRQFNSGDPWEASTSDYFFAINGDSCSGEEPFDGTTHTYVFTRTGDGTPFEFSVYDIGDLTDNSGSFTIEVCGVGVVP